MKFKVLDIEVLVNQIIMQIRSGDGSSSTSNGKLSLMNSSIRSAEGTDVAISSGRLAVEVSDSLKVGSDVSGDCSSCEDSCGFCEVSGLDYSGFVLCPDNSDEICGLDYAVVPN